MTAERLLEQLAQLRSQAQLMATTIDGLIKLIDDAIPKPEPEQPTTDENGNCLHPQDARQPIPSMGNPARFRCAACGAVGGTRERTA